MDRGRVGTLAIGNKTIRDQMIAHQQEVHLERINKIKNRKPGSSNTLDNTPPVIVKAALTNPRKKAKKDEFNMMTERENRALLQRISNTLTGVSNLCSVDDYERMHKIVQNLKGGKAQYEENILKKHHARYLKQLKNMGPYYNPREWELDYKRQKVQQMFMREVTYETPKDYVPLKKAPFKVLGTLRDEGFRPHHTQIKGAVHGLPKGATGKAGHANKIKALKDGNLLSSNQSSPHKNGRKTRDEGKGDNEEDEYGDEFEEEDNLDRKELACTHRNIKIIDESKDESHPGRVTQLWGEITVHLVEGNVLVITATMNTSADGGISASNEAINAEAEIDVKGLAEVRGLDGDAVLNNTTELVDLSKYVSEKVDVCVDDGNARIILNLLDDSTSNEDQSIDEKIIGSETESKQLGSPPRSPARPKDVGVSFADMEGDEFELRDEKSSLYEEEDLNSVIEEGHFKNSFDVTAPIRILGAPSLKKTGIRPKTEYLPLHTDLTCNGDMIVIKVTVRQDSVLQYKENCAIAKGTQFTVETLLPSIMQADQHLTQEYFANIVENLEIESNHTTGKVKCTLLDG